MNNQQFSNEVIYAMLKRGDVVEIVPNDRFPSADRILDVYEVNKNGILYHVTERCDGYVMPFSWIKSIKIIKSK